MREYRPGIAEEESLETVLALQHIFLIIIRTCPEMFKYLHKENSIFFGCAFRKFSVSKDAFD